MHTPNKLFAVTFVCRDDLRKECPQIDLRKVSDEDMQHLADEMGDAISESYWYALRDLVKSLNFPKKKGKKYGNAWETSL